MPGISTERIAAGANLPAYGRGSQTAAAVNAAQTSAAPANASSAPSKQQFTGLCEALNAHELELVQKGVYTYPNTYSIIFDPPSMANAKIKKQGATDKDQAPMQVPTNAKDAKDPTTNSMNTTAVNVQITAGMQIVQFIETTMRNSSYVSDQLVAQIDQTTGELKPSTAAPGGVTAWYKINVVVTPNQSKLDPKRNDYSYDYKYIITPFAVNKINSQWFTPSKFRGLHKSYNYWFTGQNSQVLNFEAEYSGLYTTIMSGNFAMPAYQNTTADSRVLARRVFNTRSEHSDQGAKNGANEPNASGADAMYNMHTLGEVKLKIIGDPAWLAQGELSASLPAQGGFNFRPFLDDGTINFDASQVAFDITWNRPADYDLNDTGLVNVNGGGKQPALPSENITYIISSCKSTFSRGKFEQELEGQFLFDQAPSGTTAAGTGRPATPATTAPLPRAAAVADKGNNLLNDYAKDVLKVPNSLLPAPLTSNNLLRNPAISNAVGLEQQPASAQNPAATAASPPKPPTSDGVVVSDSTAFAPPPPLPSADIRNDPTATANQFTVNGVQPTPEELAARNAYVAAGRPESGPLYDSYRAGKDALIQRVAEAAPKSTVSNPQTISKDNN